MLLSWGLKFPVPPTPPPSTFTPAQLFPANVGAWFTAYDQTYLRVNIDGTGGSPSVGGVVGRLLDRSGGGRHLSASSQSVASGTAQSGYFAMNKLTSVTGASYYSAVNGFNVGTTQTMTGMLVMDMMGVPDSNIPFSWDDAHAGNSFELTGGTGSAGGKYRFVTGGAFVNTNLIWPSQRCAIAWRGTASGFEFWINNTQYTSAALTALNLLTFRLGAGYPIKARFYEMVILPVALGNADFTALKDYGVAQANGSGFNNDVLLAVGDSLTSAFNSATVSPWIQINTQMPNAKHYCFGLEGMFASSPSLPAATLSTLYKDTGRNVAGVWLGTNDIVQVTSNGTVTAANALAYANVLKNAGWKVVICTLQDMLNSPAERLTCNTAIRAGTSNYHALADLAARSELSDCTNLTYFAPDQVHLTDAGYAVVNTVISAAIASIP